MNTTIYMTVSQLLILLILFQLKHLIADYALQIGNKFLFRKFDKHKWIFPLATHCSHHAAITWLITYGITWNPLLALYLAIFDFTTHFIVDRIKASPNMFGKYKMTDLIWWYALAVDQALHHITHYIIIITIILHIQ